MFKVNPAPTFEGTASLTVHGQAEPTTIKVTWKHKGSKAFAAWMESATTVSGDAEFLDEVIEAWEGPDKAYSRETLEQLLDAYPHAGQELYDSYLRDLRERRTGN